MKRTLTWLTWAAWSCAWAHAAPIFIGAESCKSQTLAEKRQWHIFSAQSSPQISPDGDPAHLAGASGGR